MPTLLPIRGIYPTLPEGTFLAETAVVIGDVVLGDQCSVWFGAVVRGDVHTIRIGHRTNIQDGAILHCTYKTAPLQIGSDVSIGHGAIVHGCTIHDRVLIGMGAKILDHAVIEPEVLVAAGAVVRERDVLQSGYLYAGIPAKAIKPLTDAQRQNILDTPGRYIRYARWYTNPEDLAY
jgi:carbonic anhydrase/acetyltransferase-like protein (isoleucine patch superfamily)